MSRDDTTAESMAAAECEFQALRKQVSMLDLDVRRLRAESSRAIDMALEAKQLAGNAGGPDVDRALAGAAEDIERALGLGHDHGETLPQLVGRVLEELERTRVREGRLIVRVNAMGRVVGETVEELSALVQPTAPWEDVAACSECGDPLDRPTGSERCSRCADVCYPR